MLISVISGKMNRVRKEKVSDVYENVFHVFVCYLALLDVTVLVFLDDDLLDEDRLDSRAASSNSFSIFPAAVWRETGWDREGVTVPDPGPSLAAPLVLSLASFRCWKYNSTQESVWKKWNN